MRVDVARADAQHGDGVGAAESEPELSEVKAVEAVAEVRQMKLVDEFQSGIYVIENKVNSHIYIGSSKNLAARRGSHFHSLRGGTHHSKYLQRAFDKYGDRNFEFKPLFICDIENLIIFEQMCIDKLQPEYNISPTAGNTIGTIRTAEYRKKLSEAQRKRFLDPNSRKILSDAHKGQTLTEEQRKKIGDALRGRPRPDHVKIKISEAQKGREVPESRKKKMRDAKRGTHLSDKHKKNISESLIGKTVSNETRKKLSLATKAWYENNTRTSSEETKAKISKSMKEYHARRKSD